MTCRIDHDQVSRRDFVNSRDGHRCRTRVSIKRKGRRFFNPLPFRYDDLSLRYDGDVEFVVRVELKFGLEQQPTNLVIVWVDADF